MLARGIFILDIEIELAWGVIDEKINREKLTKACRRIRDTLNDIIFLLEKYGIPVTWSILGHIVLDRCERISGVAHPEMPRPTYTWLNRDWYSYDPCKGLVDEPAFYGKDITDKIVNYTLSSKMRHDIASHSFSHQLFGDTGCSKKLAEAEVKYSVGLIYKNYGIAPKVFIFPRGSLGHYDVLRRNGIIAFRGPIPSIIGYSESKPGIWNSIRKYASLASYLMSFYFGVPPPVSAPSKEHDLINIPASMCYNKKPFIPVNLVVLKAKKGLKRAVKEKKIFYLFTHLINFGEVRDTMALLRGFEEILSYACMYRRRNELEITTIRRIAEDLFREKGKLCF